MNVKLVKPPSKIFAEMITILDVSLATLVKPHAKALLATAELTGIPIHERKYNEIKILVVRIKFQVLTFKANAMDINLSTVADTSNIPLKHVPNDWRNTFTLQNTSLSITNFGTCM